MSSSYNSLYQKAKKEKKRLKNGTGNASFRTDLIDAVFNMSKEELKGGLRDEIYERRD